LTNRTRTIEAALALCDAILKVSNVAKETNHLVKESLRHPKHAKRLKPIAERVRKLMASYFRHQKRAILHDVKYRLDEGDGKERALKILPDSVTPLSFPITSEEDQEFADAMRDAIASGASLLAKELESTATIRQTAMDKYLEKNSLEKLTGGFEETTKQRLRNAIANAVDEGADADGLIEAIQETMDEFSTFRAEMIAQTETNNAYNFGRQEMAIESGMSEKSWVTESGDPCPECVDNEDAGWLPIGVPFPSGDQMPTAHPRCYCSLDFRTTEPTLQ
jgi:hypothetical protein